MLPSYYYQRKKRKNQKLIIIGVVALLLTVTALFLFFPNNSPPVAEVLMQTKTIVLQKTATLKLSTLYACGHQRSRLLPLPEDLCQKTESETKNLYPLWKIVRFEEQFLEVEEKSETECDVHFLLKLSKNKIIVTRKNKPDEIIMEEKINPSVLTEEDKTILSSGISVNSEYELLEILESFR